MGSARSRNFSLSLIFTFALAIPALAGTSPVVVGNARFTQITPNCIRMEYSSTRQFVDEPSYFAANRVVGKAVVAAKRCRITSGAMDLEYVDDGATFSSHNLKLRVRKGSGWVTWTPDSKNGANLGGAIRTLDGFDGAGALDDGILSRNGWYLLDDSRGVLLDKGWVQSRPKDAGTDWYLFGYGEDYAAALKSLAAVSGSVPLPRRYMLGAWYSRYWPYSSKDYHDIIGEYVSHGFPLDNIVMDMDWHMDGWTGWSWNRKLLPDAEALLPWFHSEGLHVTLNVHPADGVAKHETQYAAFMKDIGEDPSTGKTVPFDASNRAYMDALFRDVHKPLEREGVDFWWLDWQQDEFTRGIPELTNLQWLNELYYRDTSTGGQRGASFSRWAGWGDQRHPIHFSGDASTNWSMLQFEVPMTSASGNSGCFFWTHDIGGHNRGRNEESYARWCQFGSMSAALRAHSTRDKTMDRRPWMYPDYVTQSIKTSEVLRSTLFPYIYTSAAQSSRSTVPLLRPMYLAHPTVEAAYHNSQEYLFGDNLLVAPIAQPGVGPGHVARQVVWFPGGEWYDWFSGVRHTGPSDELAADDIDEFPLFARGGVPIPMQPRTLRMASTPVKTLVVRCYPGVSGDSSFYEDDGVTTAYRQKAFATTRLGYVRQGNVLIVSIGGAHGHYAGEPATRSYVVELPSMDRATHAWVDGKAVAVAYDPALGINRVIVPARPVGKAVVVKVEAAPMAQSTLVERASLRRIAAVLGDSWGHSHIGDFLSDERLAGLDASRRNMVLSCVGIGLVDHDESVYGYQGDHRLHLYGPTSGSSLQILAGPAAGTPVSPMGMDGTHQVGVATLMVGGRTYTIPSSPLATADDVALSAEVTSSSDQPGYSEKAVIDGVVDGYPSNEGAEWASNYKTSREWVKLTWASPQTIDRVVLYDRPNTNDQVLAGKLTFDDGSSVDVGALPNDASAGLEVKFAPKTVTSMTFTVEKSAEKTVSTGLSEIAVYRAVAH